MWAIFQLASSVETITGQKERRPNDAKNAINKQLRGVNNPFFLFRERLMRQGDGCETYMILRNGDWLVQLKIVSYEMKDDDVATVDSAVRERCEKEFEKWRLVRTRKTMFSKMH